MNRHDEQKNVPLPELVKALQDLARLSHQGVSTAEGMPPTVASALLEQLMTQCQASRGALFLALPSPLAQERFVSRVGFQDNTRRCLALKRVDEEERQQLVKEHPIGSLWTSHSSHAPSWLYWCLPLTLSFPFHLQMEDQKLRKEAPSPSALLLLGWDEPQEELRASAVQKAVLLLPLLADSIGTVIARILSSEYLEELEVSADRKAHREMEVLKAELLATVSHELRSPLASIRGYAATLLRLERRISREERREFLLAIKESSDRLAGVIDALLEISQLQTGTIELEWMPIDIAHLIREAVRAAEPRRESSSILGGPVLPSPLAHPTFIVHLQDRHGDPLQDELLIEADHNRLREVLDHLLKNAVIHAREDGVIDVLLRPVSSPEDLSTFPELTAEAMTKIRAVQRHSPQVIVIRVRDSGKGISPHHLTRIFEPFYRVDSGLTRETGGLGLGLAICRDIVELHHGELWGESIMGKGSTFYVCLPQQGQQKERTE